MEELQRNLINWLMIVLLFLVCAAVLIYILSRIRQQFGFHWIDWAFKDDLTGVFNQNAYRRTVQQMRISKSKKTWLLVFDIDNFKKINDTQGHLQGDRILIDAAHRLRGVFCTQQYRIYRIGGDEFVVLAENVREEQVAERLRYLREMERHEETFRFSKGYAMIKGHNSDAVERAFADADRMLYTDKRSRKPVKS